MMKIITAGECLEVDSELEWAARLIATATGVMGAAGAAGSPEAGVTQDAAVMPEGAHPTVRLLVQETTREFCRRGLRIITRGAYGDGRRTLLVNAGGCGFDLLVNTDDESLDITARYRPTPAVRALNVMCSRRFGLLAGQILAHYPALWRAGWRGRVPLHVAAFALPSGTPMIAGPGGVGKSTLLTQLMCCGAKATADNLCAADEHCCYGLAEPIRTDGGCPGMPRPTLRSRVDRPIVGRLSHVIPDRIVVLERRSLTETPPIVPIVPAPPIVPISAEDEDEDQDAVRVLVSGTYAAGELRRYWAFAATLALATGRGPAHPPVETIARSYAERLPLVIVRIRDGETVGIERLCQEAGVT